MNTNKRNYFAHEGFLFDSIVTGELFIGDHHVDE